jgi:hypothetical protein
MNLKGKIKILDSNLKIEKNILNICESEIKNMFRQAASKMRADVINLVVEALNSCPEIESLRNGKLRYDFGLSADPTSEIVYAIANSTYVYFKNFKFYLNYHLNGYIFK